MTPIEVALSFLGATEKPNNGGFYNERLQALMTTAGHKPGEAWCCYFMEACFCEALKEREAELRKIFSASCVTTFNNFQAAGYTITKVPFVGALGILRKYKDGEPTWQGHAILVLEVIDQLHYRSIEGNTNASGSREGTLVGVQPRSTKFRSNGLNLMGFIKI